MEVPDPGTTVKVEFYGLQGKSGKAAGYINDKWNCPDYRYGFVGITADGISIIGNPQKADYNNQAGSAMFTAPADNKLKYLWLIVMGAPNIHWKNPDEGKDAQWPYMLKFKGTKPLSENLK